MTGARIRRHGHTHRPGSSDASEIGIAHLIGEAGEPAFLNGCYNDPGNEVLTDPTPLQFYLTAGHLNLVDVDGETILAYGRHELTIVGDVIVPLGSWGLPVFQLPALYRFPTSRPYHGHDEYGGFVSGRLYKNGYFVKGVA
ncbi:MAG TPA: hypothetical protein VF731_02340 [Solirubrobacterales bacterium]